MRTNQPRTRMLRFLLSLMISLCFFSVLSGQNSQQYSLYFMNKGQFNPAAVGMDENVILTAGTRNQWSGVLGTPISQHGNIQFGAAPLSGGVGLFFEQEQMGNSKSSRASLAYAYALNINRNSSLRFGLATTWDNFQLDGNLIRTPDGVYEGTIFNHEDDLLSNGLLQGSNLSTDIGVFYINNNFEAGFSMLNAYELPKQLGNMNFKRDPAYYLYLARGFDLNRRLEMTPSVLIKSILSQSQLDLGVKFQYNDNILFGASFRGYSALSVDAVVPFLGYYFSERFSLSYSYDIGLSALQTIHGGSHEIIIRYDLGKAIWKGKLPPIIYNQRHKS